MKLTTALTLTAFTLAGCGNDHEQPNTVIVQPAPQQVQPIVQQPMVQPQVIVQPVPVIVQQPPQYQHTDSGSSVGAFALGAAAGAVAGHLLTKDSVDEHKHTDNDHEYVQPSKAQPVQSAETRNVAPTVQPSQKQSAMDMNKLSESANFKPSSEVKTEPTVQQPKAAMDMNKLSASSSTTPTQVAPTTPKLDMSKLSQPVAKPTPTVSLAKPPVAPKMDVSKMAGSKPTGVASRFGARK